MSWNDSAHLNAELRKLLARELQVPLEQVSPELAFGDLPEWDSLGHMNVMMGLETQFGVEITADTIAELTSLPAIRAYLQRHDHA